MASRKVKVQILQIIIQNIGLVVQTFEKESFLLFHRNFKKMHIFEYTLGRWRTALENLSIKKNIMLFYLKSNTGHKLNAIESTFTQALQLDFR